MAPAVKHYLVSVVGATRTSRDLRLGASPRASLQLLRAVRAYAALQGRDYVTPDDVQALAVPVLAHRVLLSSEAQLARRSAEDVIARAARRGPGARPRPGPLSPGRSRVRRVWTVLTVRGRWLAGTGLVVLLGAMVSGQRDVMRVGLLLLALPVVALVLVLRARLRMSAERSVEPAQVALGTPMHGRITLGHDSLLPAALLELEDQVPARARRTPPLPGRPRPPRTGSARSSTRCSAAPAATTAPGR